MRHCREKTCEVMWFLVPTLLKAVIVVFFFFFNCFYPFHASCLPFKARVCGYVGWWWDLVETCLMMCMGFALSTAPVIHEQCEPSPGSTNTRDFTMKYTFSFVFCHLLRQLCVCACVLGVLSIPQAVTGQHFYRVRESTAAAAVPPIRCAVNVFFCHIRSDAAASFSLARGKHHRRAESQHAFECWAILTHCIHWFQAARVWNPVIRSPVFTSHEQFPCIPEWRDGQSRSWFQQPEQPEIFPHFISDCFGTCWGQMTDLYLQEHVTEAVAWHNVSR